MKVINVTAAIIIKDKKILIAKRRSDDIEQNRWEFPGGKIDPNESAEDCLKRELKEELNIDATIESHFLDVAHKYKDKSIKLISFIIRDFTGEIKALDHEELKFVPIDDLIKYDFLDADKPIVKKILSSAL